MVGLSMGGFATLHFGFEYPDRALSLTVAGCGYGAEPGKREQFRKETEATANGIQAKGMDEVGKVYALGPTRVQFQNKDPRGWAEFETQLREHSSLGGANTMRGVQARRPSLYDLTDKMQALTVPTLIVNGDEDEPCLEPGLLMKRMIPSAALSVLPKTGHTMNIEEPALFNAVVEDFLHTVECGRWTLRPAVDGRRSPDGRSGHVIGGHTKPAKLGEGVVSKRLQGRAAIVTGGARGIGKAICEAFADAGAAVWVKADLHGAEAEALADDLRARGVEAGGGYCDVRSFDGVRDVVDTTAAEAFGHLDTLVANAATLTPFATVEDLEESDWTQALAVNLTGAFHLCKHGLPHLKRNGGGSIILTASQMARVGTPGSAAYCTTKGGLVQLARTMALDHAADNIRVNTLSPGGTATDRLFNKFGSPEAAEKSWGEAMHPLGRLGRPDEIAKGAVFLASKEASFMTGSDLLMDGGFSAR